MTRATHLLTALSIVFACGMAVSDAAEKTSKKTTFNKNNTTVGTLAPNASYLTAQECKGLGGVASTTPPGDKCTTAQTCFVTDKHGVIRTACIDEVAPD